MKRSKIKAIKSKSIYRTFEWKKLDVFENRYWLLKWMGKCAECKCILDLRLFGKQTSRWKSVYRYLCKKCKYNKDIIYRENNKKHILIKKSEYYYSNKDTLLEKQKYKYHNNKERRYKVHQRTKSWVKENPEANRAIQQRMRVKRKYWITSTDDWTITWDSIKNMLKSQKNMCILCGNYMWNKYTLDHCQSLFDWWAHSIKNIQIMCKRCNSSKNKNSFRVVDWKIILL